MILDVGIEFGVLRSRTRLQVYEPELKNANVCRVESFPRVNSDDLGSPRNDRYKVASAAPGA